MTVRKYTRNRRIFPNDDSALKSLFLAIREASKRWRGVHHWKAAIQIFQILFGEDRGRSMVNHRELNSWIDRPFDLTAAGGIEDNETTFDELGATGEGTHARLCPGQSGTWPKPSSLSMRLNT